MCANVRPLWRSMAMPAILVPPRSMPSSTGAGAAGRAVVGWLSSGRAGAEGRGAAVVMSAAGLALFA